MKNRRQSPPIQTDLKYKTLVENIPDYAIFMLDKKGNVSTWDKGAASQLGYKKSEIMDKPFSIFYNKQDTKAKKPAFNLAEAKLLGRHIEERPYIKKNGKEYWGTAVITSVVNERGTHLGFSMIVRDITEEKNLHEIVLHRSNHDYLTGLPNRRTFEERFLEAIKSNKEKNLLAIFFLDFNNFKHINDKQGHGFGDAVLIQIAARLLRSIRQEDVVARLGGDEFVILCCGFSDVQGIKDFAEKIVRTFHKPFKVGKITVNTTISMGIAIYPTDAKKASQLLHYSDVALYKAKKNGGNQYWFYNET